MKKLSNNTLAILLIIAIFVSFIGTWISVSYLDSLNQLTGFATEDTGNVSLTVSTDASCTVTDDSISFGTQARGDSNSSEILDTPDFIVVNNNGNTLLNITANATGELWAVATYASPNDAWLMHCNSSSAGNCNETYTPVPGGATGPTPKELVNVLTATDGSDNLTVGVNITVPADETAGSKDGTITFYCTES